MIYLKIIVFFVISLPYYLIVYLRNIIFLTFSSALQIKLQNYVISVGNLTTGGTGKTPFIDWLLSQLKNEFNISVVSKSYRSQLKKSVAIINSNDSESLNKSGSESINTPLNGALYYGDEPFMLSQKHKDVSFFCGPYKFESALLAQKTNPQAQVILIDDGFQHLKLFRNLDLLLIDSSQINSLKLFPFGLAREPFKAAINRADFIILTKTHLCKPEDLNLLKNKILKDLNKGASHLFLSDYHLNWPLLEASTKAWIVVSGIANNKTFVDDVINHYGNDKVLTQKLYPDHYQYQSTDIDEIKRLLNIHTNAKILTTEKDAIKLKDLLDPDKLKSVQLQMQVTDGERLIRSICDKIRSRY